MQRTSRVTDPRWVTVAATQLRVLLLIVKTEEDLSPDRNNCFAGR